MVDSADQIVVNSYWIAFGLETKHWIQVQNLLFDYQCLSYIVEDKKSWFASMDVLDLNDVASFFTAKYFGCQPTTSQFFNYLLLRPEC